METIKKGSKGDAVKVLQKALGITPVDGIFGKNTEAVVIAWQKSHSLQADGIVGSATWKALGMITESKTEVKTDSKCVDSSVVYAPLSVHVSKKSNRSINWIVIHYTAGANSNPGRALNTKKVFEKREASADFCVDDATMVQFNPDLRNYYCWSVGDSLKKNNGGKYYGKCLNSNSVSIEVCSTCTPATSPATSTCNHSGWSFTDKALDNTRKLVKILMKKYNIPLSHVIRHYDVSGKMCPGLIGWNDEIKYKTDGTKTKERNNSKKWEEFKASLED